MPSKTTRANIRHLNGQVETYLLKISKDKSKMNETAL